MSYLYDFLLIGDGVTELSQYEIKQLADTPIRDVLSLSHDGMYDVPSIRRFVDYSKSALFYFTINTND